MSWTATKLKYLARAPITNGLGEAAQEGAVEWPRYIRTTDIASPRSLDPEKRVTLPPEIAVAALVQRGDLLLCAAGSLGKTYLHDSDERACYAGYLVRFRADSKLADPRFVSYWSQSQPFLDQLAVGAVRSTIDNFSAGKYQNMSLSAPSLDEQRRIVDFLDDQVPQLDRVIQLRAEQERLELERFRALREESIENRWPYRRLRLVTSPTRPINYGVLMPGPQHEGGIPLIEAGDVMRGPIDLTELRRTDPTIEAEFTRSRLATGDCVMAIRGSIGVVQTVPPLTETVNVTRDAARIVPTFGLVKPGYLRHALSTLRAQDWLKLRAGGAAVKGINIADLRRLPVACPDTNDQAVIERELDEAEEQYNELRELTLMSNRLIEERKQALITAAVTGQFDVTTARAVA